MYILIIHQFKNGRVPQKRVTSEVKYLLEGLTVFFRLYLLFLSKLCTLLKRLFLYHTKNLRSSSICYNQNFQTVKTLDGGSDRTFQIVDSIADSVDGLQFNQRARTYFVWAELTWIAHLILGSSTSGNSVVPPINYWENNKSLWITLFSLLLGLAEPGVELRNVLVNLSQFSIN